MCASPATIRTPKRTASRRLVGCPQRKKMYIANVCVRHAKRCSLRCPVRRAVSSHFWINGVWRAQRHTEGSFDGKEAGAERASGAVQPGHHNDCARAQITPTASTASAAAARLQCRPVRRRSPQDSQCAGPQRRAPCARLQQLAEWQLLLFAAYGGSSNGCLSPPWAISAASRRFAALSWCVWS